MALINCPECGAKISTLASFCPHCGWQPAAADAAIERQKQEPEKAAPIYNNIEKPEAPQPQVAPEATQKRETPVAQPTEEAPATPQVEEEVVQQPQNTEAAVQNTEAAAQNIEATVQNTEAAAPLNINHPTTFDIYDKLSVAGAALGIALVVPLIFWFGRYSSATVEPWYIIALFATFTGTFISACRRERFMTTSLAILSLIFFIDFTGDLPTQYFKLQDDVDSLYNILYFGSLGGAIAAGVGAVLSAMIGSTKSSKFGFSLTKLDILMGMMFVIMMLMPKFHSDWYEVRGGYDEETWRSNYMAVLLGVTGIIGVAATVGRRYSVALAMAAVALIMQVVNIFYIFDVELDSGLKEWVREAHLNVSMSSIATITLVGTVALTIVALIRNRDYDSERPASQSNDLVTPAILFVIAIFVSNIPSISMMDAEYIDYLKSSGESIEADSMLLAADEDFGVVYACLMYATLALLMCRNFIAAGVVSTLTAFIGCLLMSKAGYVANSFVALLPIILFGVIALLAFASTARGREKRIDLDMIFVAGAGAVLTVSTNDVHLLPLYMAMLCVTGRYKIASVALSIIALLMFSNELVYDFDKLTVMSKPFAYIIAIAKWTFILAPLIAPLRWALARLTK